MATMVMAVLWIQVEGSGGGADGGAYKICARYCACTKAYSSPFRTNRITSQVYVSAAVNVC